MYFKWNKSLCHSQKTWNNRNNKWLSVTTEMKDFFLITDGTLATFCRGASNTFFYRFDEEFLSLQKPLHRRWKKFIPSGRTNFTRKPPEKAKTLNRKDFFFEKKGLTLNWTCVPNDVCSTYCKKYFFKYFIDEFSLWIK